jgi:hypothetical protein
VMPMPSSIYVQTPGATWETEPCQIRANAVEEWSDEQVISFTSICARAMKRRMLVRQTLKVVSKMHRSKMG